MKCLVCGAGELVYDIRNVPYTYKGETSGILGVTGDFCPACAEGILENEEGQRFYAPVREFNKQGNAAFVEPEFVLRVRNKLGLAQREAAGIFGGGINAFSRYENGRTNHRWRC